TVNPYIGVINYNNSMDYSNQTGTIQLIGGTVYEDDGTVVTDINGVPLSLDTLIRMPAYSGIGLPPTDDTIQFTNVQYTLKPNHKALFKYQLITAGCVPEVAQESTLLNATLPTDGVSVNIPSVIQQIGELPSLTETLDCLNAAMQKFRSDISIESTAVFQSEIISCLTDLKEQSEDVFGRVFDVSYSQYHTVVS